MFLLLSLLLFFYPKTGFGVPNRFLWVRLYIRSPLSAAASSSAYSLTLPETSRAAAFAFAQARALSHPATPHRHRRPDARRPRRWPRDACGMAAGSAGVRAWCRRMRADGRGMLRMAAGSARMAAARPSPLARIAPRGMIPGRTHQCRGARELTADELINIGVPRNQLTSFPCFPPFAF